MLKNFSSKNSLPVLGLDWGVSIKTDHEDIRCDCVDWVWDKLILKLEDLDWIQPA